MPTVEPSLPSIVVLAGMSIGIVCPFLSEDAAVWNDLATIICLYFPKALKKSSKVLTVVEVSA